MYEKGMEKPLKIIGKVWKSVENVCERYEKRKSMERVWKRGKVWIRLGKARYGKQRKTCRLADEVVRADKMVQI